ncbi:MAG TPA: efflux RND transporter permease subunit [Vicinamibacterales bacterium]|nr:efflux RND transporter permease subunit [Vicinamibacterales bacterium]
MKFTDLFVKRPVLAIVVNLVIVIAGLQSIRALSVRQYPRSDIAVVKVSTAYIGANADLVRGFITTPLERVIASADGIDYLESSSGQGVSTITVHLKLNYDTNAALTQIQAKVAQVRNDLPPEAEAPIIDLETADNQFASIYLGFSSTDLDPNQVTDYLTRVVQPKLSAIAGVQRADILGARTFAMRIWLKPDRMAAYGIAPSAVHDVLARNNYLSALGRTKGSMVSVNLVANTDLRTPDEFRQLVVKEQDGVVVRLGQIADVVLGAESYDQDVRFNGEAATFMGIWVLPTANSLEVIGKVREAIPQIQAQLPAGMKLGVPYDATAYIHDAINEVLSTLTETLLIVVVVIFLFLGSFRSVLIPIVAIPISLVGAVFLMLAAGFTLNLLTLLAIVLSVGLVVDDAIVMVENIERHLHQGKPPVRAAIDAARELVGPIIAMTITLAAVYTPVGIQGGLTGSLFREFAFTLAGAVIVSGVVALTLSPMMGAKLLRAGDTERGFAGWINRRFEGVRQRYAATLSATLRYRPVVLVLWAIVGLLTVPFYMFSQRELAPAEDQGFFFGVVQASANATLDQTRLFTDQIQDVYRSFPETAGTFQITLPTGGFGGMVTKPWSERKKTTQQLLMQSMGPLSKIAGLRVIPMAPPPLPGGGDFPVDLVIASAAEPKELGELAGQLVKKAFASGMFIYADADLKFDQPQAEVVFDRDKLRSQGVDLSQAGRDLSTILGGDYVNRFSIQGRSYKVIPQIARAERLTPEQLSQIYVTGGSGSASTLVPLSTFATLRTSTEPRELKKFQQLNAVRIQGVIPPSVPLDQALQFLENEARAIMPQGFAIDYAGESRQLRTEGGKFLGIFALSAVLIYLVLAAQFESFRDPFIILAGSVPLAMAGALLFSFLGLTTLNIYSQVGLITLVGLVSKNGILIVQFANHLQEAGLDKFAAVTEAAGTRLRPILMTTAATVVGHFPLVLATGPGAGARNSIGIMLVTGMVVGTVFTLFVVPSIYTFVAKTRKAVADEMAPAMDQDQGRGRLPQVVAGAAALGVLLVATSAFAQVAQPASRPVAAETLPLTIDDAIRRAIDRNPDLAIVRLASEADTARVAESRGAFTPVFSSSLGRSSSATPPASILTGDRGVDVDDWFSSTGVRQRLPWSSGTWSVSWDTSRTATNNPISSVDPSLQAGVQVAFSQPLLKDRAIDAARLQYTVAKRNQESADLRSREAAVQTIAAVKQAYWTLKASLANVTVQQRSLDLARDLARENKIRVDAGQIPPLDLVQAEAEVAQRRESLIRARTVAEDAEDALRRLIVDPADASFWRVRLDPVEEPPPASAAPDVDAAVATALNERYDLARAGHELENARTTVSFLSNQRLPDVRLEASYRGSGLGGTQFLRAGGFPGVITGTRNRGLGDAVGQVFSNDYPTWSVGLTVSYPLGRSYEAASLARGEIERRQAEQRIASLRLQAAETIRRAGRQVQSTAERVDAARAGAELAQQRLEAEQRRYAVGLSTTFLVTQAQRDLLEAQVTLLQTSLDYQSAVVNFEAVQQAPPAGADLVGAARSSVVSLPTPAPRGIFRTSGGAQ